MNENDVLLQSQNGLGALTFFRFRCQIPISDPKTLNRPSPSSEIFFPENAKKEKNVGNVPTRADRDTTKFLLNLEKMATTTTKSHSKSHPNENKEKPYFVIQKKNFFEDL